MRVLFVDDEPRVLDGMRRTFYALADEWDVDCVGGGEEALRHIAEKPYDVVVSDMRMPGMDGATLLREVYNKYPDVIRIVLSGYSEEETALRLVPVAHQFLSKPCMPTALREAVDRVMAYRNRVETPAVRKLVGSIEKLPSLSSVYTRLQQAMDNPDISPRDVANIVREDPAMTAKVLQLVNSAFFGRGSSVGDIQTAVTRLGVRVLRNLALSIQIFETAGSSDSIALIETLQRNALRASLLAARMPADKTQVEIASLGALLADVGKLVLARGDATSYMAMLAEAQKQGIADYTIERERFGCSHAEVGACLLGLWSLPTTVIEVVAFHHELPREAPPSIAPALAAVHCALHSIEGLPIDGAWFDAQGLSGQLDGYTKIARTA